MKWSVSVIAEGDREVSRDEVVELADAVAGLGGIASGIGTPTYGAQLVIDAEDREAAVERGKDEFARAASRAGLPSWPITHVEAISEADDELGDLE
ncbi:MAG TPA: hypothetical protein VKB59_17145 [Micromonosporaceae bacterium]|nr:hypothetical protein [Micromonosporaceae bacterium]